MRFSVTTQKVASTNEISRQENLKITEKEQEQRERDNGRDIVKRKETLDIWFLE